MQDTNSTTNKREEKAVFSLFARFDTSQLLQNDEMQDTDSTTNKSEEKVVLSLYAWFFVAKEFLVRLAGAAKLESGK
jgi:hypothetical protein